MTYTEYSHCVRVPIRMIGTRPIPPPIIAPLYDDINELLLEPPDPDPEPEPEAGPRIADH